MNCAFCESGLLRSCSYCNVVGVNCRCLCRFYDNAQYPFPCRAVEAYLAENSGLCASRVFEWVVMTRRRSLLITLTLPSLVFASNLTVYHLCVVSVRSWGFVSQPLL